MVKVLRPTALAILLLFVGLKSEGQVSIAALNTAYTQNFSTLSASSCPCSATPTHWVISETGSGGNGTYAANSGTGTTGDTYAYYSGTGTEFCLGGLASNTVQTRFGVSYTNSTGSTITQLDISYYGEYWRLGATARVDQLDFQYSTDATSISTGTWTDFNSLDFVNTGLALACTTGTLGARDGNSACRKLITASITGLSIANGTTFWLRWNDFNATGADDGMGIDDYSLTAQAAAATPTVNLSISSASGTEGVGTTYTLTATASAAVSGNQTVDIALPTGTGIAAGDFSGITFTRTITITSGNTTGTATFTINDDATLECAETATFAMSNYSAGITAGSTTTQNFTINDNDLPTVQLSISASSGSEGVGTTYTLTATASAAVLGAQTVSIATPTGTGITSGDFSGITFPVTVTIANGATTGTTTFTVNDDATYEGSETATFAISSPSSCITLGTTTTQAFTISDNDNPNVNLSISSATGSEATPSTVITLTATTSVNVVGDQTVTVAAPTGTNITTGDFSNIAFPVTITILNGTNTGTATFTVTDDATYECSETATFAISSPSSGITLGTTTTQTFTITDNEALPTVQLSISGSTGTEGSATTYTLTATSSAAVVGAQTVTVGLSGTGLTTGDFTGVTFPVTITIANGATTGSTSAFTVTNDAAVENTETATFSITGTSSCITTGVTTTQNFTITDNDFATVNLSISATGGTEGAATTYTLTATASTAVVGAQTVDVVVPTGTGISSGDFSGITFTATITIANGATTGTTTFTINNDVTYECSETATFAISNPQGGCITLGSTTTRTFAITDNDFPTVNLSISGTTVTEGASTTFTLTATASAAVIGAQTVSIATPTGTGVAAADFSGITFPVTVTIANGTTTGSTTFTVNDDATYEGTETATFAISSPSSCISLGSTTTQTLTITDNESPPCIDESFTGTTFAPTGWAATNVTRSTTLADYNTGPAAAFFGSFTGTLTTTSVAYPSSMTFYLGRSSSTTAKTLYVKVSTVSQTGPFTTIATYDHSNVTASTYNQYTVSLSSYSLNSTVWIEFEKSSGTTSPWRLDDVVVTCANPCSFPAVNTPSTTPVVCYGDGQGSITINATGGVSPYTYSIDGGATYQSSNVFSGLAAGTFSVKAKSTGGCESPVTSTIVGGPTATLVASVSIANNNTYVCTGTSNTFTATPTNGGTPSYQWKKNGSNVGTNSNQYTAAAFSLSDGDEITVVMTPTGCGVPSPATSNSLYAQGLVVAPTTVWNETFGTGTSGTLAGYSYTYQGGLSYTGTADAGSVPQIVNTGSAGSLSQGSIIFIPAYTTGGNGNKYVYISNINTVASNPNILSFYVSSTSSGTYNYSSGFALDYSTDGTNYFPLSYPNIVIPNNNDWTGPVTINGSLPAASNLTLRFTNSGPAMRLDDIKFQAYSTSDPAISVSPSALVCGSGAVTLTATPNTVSSISWNNPSYFNPDNPTTFSATTDILTTDRTFIATLTDAFGCTDTAMAAIVVNPIPAVKAVTGGGSYCSGGTGLSVGLTTNAQSTVLYELFLDGVSVDTRTGSTSSTNLFTNQTAAGNYTIVGSADGCTATMTGSVNIVVNPLPTDYNVTGTGSYCIGGAGVTVGLSGSQTSTSYQLRLNGVDAGSPVAGTGSSISFGNQTEQGTYTVAATNTSLTPNCSATMSGNAVVSINPKATVQFGTSTPLFSEGFTSGLPSGWSINTPSGSQYDWTFTSFTPVSSGYTGASGGGSMMTLQSVAGANSTTISQLISPNYNITGYSNITVSWGARKTTLYPSDGTFYFSTNNGTSWTPVSFVDVLPNLTWAMVNSGVPVSLPLPAGATSLKLRWDAAATTTTANYRIDDVKVYGLANITACNTLSPVEVPYASATGSSTTYSVTAVSPALSGLTLPQNGTLSTAGGTLNIAIPANSTTGNYSFTVAVNNSNSCAATYTLPVTLSSSVCGYVWTGNSPVDSNWATALNWQGSLVPPNGCSSNVTIPASRPQYPVLTSNISVGDITLGNNTRVTIQSDSLSICGTLTGGSATVATFRGTGKVVLKGSAQQAIGGRTSFETLRLYNTAGAQMQAVSAIEIYGVLELPRGIFDVNGNVLKFKAQSATDYGYLNNFGTNFSGSILGEVTAELKVFGNNFQHFVGSPVSGTLSKFGANGSAGYVQPLYSGGLCNEARSVQGGPYGRVFSWEEDKAPIAPGGPCPIYGWKVENSGATAISAAKGYSVYLSAGTFNITGAPNQNTSYTVGNLSNTGYALNSMQHPTGNIYTSGWHLLGNPYLAPYDMLNSLIANSSNFDDLMVWVASGPFSGTYQSLVSGNYNGNMLAPFQGVMVHRGNGGSASAPQGTASYPFNKSFLKTPTTLPQFTRQASQQVLNIHISGNGFQDITYVEFNDATGAAFDVGYDSRKMMSAVGQPTIYTLLNSESMSANINHAVGDVSTMPLHVSPGADGTFTITIDGMSGFDATSYVYLEDKVTGAYLNVRDSSTYVFSMNEMDDPDRFVLHFTPPLETSTTNGTCFTDATITLEQPGTANWNYALSKDSVLISSGVLNQNTPATVSVEAGTHTLTLVDNNGYTVIRNIQVFGLQGISASMNVSATTAEEGESLSFENTSSNAVDIVWDFGDGSIVGGISNPDYAYSEPGVYTVTLTVVNADGCAAVVTQQITITESAVSGLNNPDGKAGIVMWSSGNKVYVDFSTIKNMNAIIDIYNVLGQQLSSAKLSRSAVYTKSFENFGVGYVIVRVKNDESITTKKLFIADK